MFKRALIYILVLAAIVMVCLGLFVQARGACAELYDTTASDGVEMLQFAGLPQGRTLLVGQYTDGVYAGDLFARAYAPGSGSPLEARCEMDGAAITLQQIVPMGKETHLVCLITPRAQEAVSYGAVYVLDEHFDVREVVSYKEDEETPAYGFDRFVCASADGQAYAGIQNQRVTVFNQQGETILRINSEQTRDVYDVRYSRAGVLIAGCTSESGLKETVHRGFCALYDLEGNRIWRKAVAGEEGVRAAVVRILDNGQAGWILYGRYDIEKFSQINPKGIPFRFKAETGNHVFLMDIDQAGTIGKQVFYGDASPYLVNQSLSAENGLLLQSYTATGAGADRYNLRITRLDHNLEEIGKGEIPVWGDQVCYSASWAEKAQDGIWIYHAGKVRFYDNEQAVSNHFTAMRKWRPVCEAALSMAAGAPWFLCLYFTMTLSTLGTARSPHSSRYGVFCRKKRRV
ncbi:MAG: hypothetical protein IKU26_02110 [Clostridia bacterium]|nr:hypothetical protein [Clostridia bacterium]